MSKIMETRLNPDLARLITQAHAIEAVLRDAGIGSGSLVEGVLRLVAERDRLMSVMGSGNGQ